MRDHQKAPQTSPVPRHGVLTTPAVSLQPCKVCGQPEGSHVHELERWQSMDKFDPLLAAYNNGNGDQR